MDWLRSTFLYLCWQSGSRHSCFNLHATYQGTEKWSYPMFFFFPSHLEVNLLISISSPEVGWSSKLICCLWETCSVLISQEPWHLHRRNSVVAVCFDLKGEGIIKRGDIRGIISLWKVHQLKISQRLSLFSSEVWTGCCRLSAAAVTVAHEENGDFLNHFWVILEILTTPLVPKYKHQNHTDFQLFFN